MTHRKKTLCAKQLVFSFAALSCLCRFQSISRWGKRKTSTLSSQRCVSLSLSTSFLHPPPPPPPHHARRIHKQKVSFQMCRVCVCVWTTASSVRALHVALAALSSGGARAVSHRATFTCTNDSFAVYGVCVCVRQTEKEQRQ